MGIKQPIFLKMRESSTGSTSNKFENDRDYIVYLFPHGIISNPKVIYF